MFDFEFADSETNFIQERSIDLPIATQPLLIRFPSTKIAKTYFKANLPYFGQVDKIKYFNTIHYVIY